MGHLTQQLGISHLIETVPGHFRARNRYIYVKKLREFVNISFDIVGGCNEPSLLAG